MANLDALFFTPSGYSDLLGNRKVYNMRSHVEEIGHLITHADGNPLWTEHTDEATSDLQPQ